MRALGRFLLWDFPRASWQYDVMVVLILVFIFATPREIFRDQPKATSIVMLPAQQGFLLEPDLLRRVPEAERASQATEMVRKRFKTRATVTRVEPVFAEEELTGYVAMIEQQ
jgi:hypothetical protein